MGGDWVGIQWLAQYETHRPFGPFPLWDDDPKSSAEFHVDFKGISWWELIQSILPIILRYPPIIWAWKIWTESSC